MLKTMTRRAGLWSCSGLPARMVETVNQHPGPPKPGPTIQNHIMLRAMCQPASGTQLRLPIIGSD